MDISYAHLNERRWGSYSTVLLPKAMLSILIEQRIDALGLTQAEAAERMGLRQPEVSKIVCGVNSGFSFERLLAALTTLGNGIEIIVREAAPQKTSGFLRVIKGEAADTALRPVGAASAWSSTYAVQIPRAGGTGEKTISRDCHCVVP